MANRYHLSDQQQSTVAGKRGQADSASVAHQLGTPSFAFYCVFKVGERVVVIYIYIYIYVYGGPLGSRNGQSISSKNNYGDPVHLQLASEAIRSRSRSRPTRTARPVVLSSAESYRY